MPIVWNFPDGHIELTTLSEEYLEQERHLGETTVQAVTRLAKVIAEKTPHLQAASPSLVVTAAVPTDRSQRDSWRLKDGVIEA